MTVEGLVSFVAAAGVEKADKALEGHGWLEGASEGTLASYDMRGTDKAAVSNGMLSSPLTEQGLPL